MIVKRSTSGAVTIRKQLQNNYSAIGRIFDAQASLVANLGACDEQVCYCSEIETLNLVALSLLKKTVAQLNDANTVTADKVEEAEQAVAESSLMKVSEQMSRKENRTSRRKS